jgi:hypothetical protein
MCFRPLQKKSLDLGFSEFATPEIVFAAGVNMFCPLLI